jgi:signal transduction histidine kinase/ligand-binding sensor domain-containing protein
MGNKKTKHIFFPNIIASICMLLFLNICHQASFSQKRYLKFETYDIYKGLSHNTVHCITQDKEGFLWVGTEDGLNRFDGYNFEIFNKKQNDPHSISDNFITCLFIDSKNTLWVGTNSAGFNRYDKYKERFKSFKNAPIKGNSNSIKIVNSIVEDSRGNIWIGTFGGLYQFDPIKEEFISVYNDQSEPKLSGSNIRSLYMDKGDILWIGTNAAGLNRFDIKKKEVKYYRHNPTNSHSLTDNSVSYILRDRKQRLWIGTSKGLNILDESSGTFTQFLNDTKKPLSISDNTIFCITEDHINNIWITTLNGLNQYKEGTFEFYNWKHDYEKEIPIIDNHVFIAFEDKYGQMWLGTSTKGLSKFNNRVKQFEHAFHQAHNPNSISDNTIREIYEDTDGKIWIGTLNGGLNIYDPITKNFTFYKNNPSVPGSISEDRVLSVLHDSKENIWVGTWDGGLNRALSRKGKLYFKQYRHHPKDTNSIASNVIQEIKEDKYGRIWLGTEQGLDLFDLKTESFIHFAHQPDNKNSLIHNSIQSGCVIFDERDHIWVGTWGGLSRIDLSDVTKLPKRYVNYTQNDTTKFKLNENRIISLLLDHNVLWAGTFGGGLNKITLGDNFETIIGIEHYTEENGLPNNVVYSILEDDKGNLWLSTNNGLSRFNPNSETFENFDENDGLQSIQYYWGAGCKLRSGKLMFGGINGYNSFYPDSITSDTVMTDMVITDFRIFNKKIELSDSNRLNTSIIYADQLNLSWKDKVISFEFSGMQFSEPQKNRYAYKLEGFDKEWMYTDANKRFAVYTNLDPGTYTFKVKSANADGIWNEKSKEITIKIRPPFWRTTWFILSVIVFILFLLLIIYKIRVSSLQRQKKHLQYLVDIKTREVKNQNEQLQAVNEELTASNEELHDQREELKLTLNTLKEAQNQLVLSEKMASLGLLAAGVAHEINNPLNFIQGGITAIENFLNEHVKDHNQTTDPMLKAMQLGIDRATAIVKGMNRYSRTDENYSNCDIHTVIENCLILLHNELKHRIQIIKDFSDQSLVIYCNETKIHQAFLNIIQNAVHAIEGEGTITITTRQIKDIVKITVTDTGKGIKEDIIHKIFDPFFTTKEPGKGTGLGLSITYNIINEHKGNISVESIEEKGATFEITFPHIKSE